MDLEDREETLPASEEEAETASGYWLPDVNDTVLVLYLPAEQGDGFVIGGIGG